MEDEINELYNLLRAKQSYNPSLKAITDSSHVTIYQSPFVSLVEIGKQLEISIPIQSNLQNRIRL